MNLNEIKNPVLFYDGQCNLCNGAVQFVLSREKNDQIRFASLQSELGKRLISKYNLQDVDSLILYENGRIFLKSNAALRVAKHLKQPYNSLSKLGFIPALLRNAVYDLIAKFRYSIFGKTESCQIPEKNTLNRFLDV